MLSYSWSSLLVLLNVAGGAKTTGEKLSQLSSEDLLDLDNPLHGTDSFYPFFPGIDEEMSLFGHPSFSVARAHPSSRHCPPNRFQPCLLRFENHLPPTGRQFDRSQGAFICNVPGLYYFSFSALSPAFSSARLSLTKNDHEVVSAYAAAIGNHMAFNSILLLLRAGDKVCVKLFEGELYESENRLRAYTSFNGFLIQSAMGGAFWGMPTPPPLVGQGFIPHFGNGVSTVNGGGKPLEAGPRKLSNDTRTPIDV